VRVVFAFTAQFSLVCLLVSNTASYYAQLGLNPRDESSELGKLTRRAFQLDQHRHAVLSGQSHLFAHQRHLLHQQLSGTPAAAPTPAAAAAATARGKASGKDGKLAVVPPWESAGVQASDVEKIVLVKFILTHAAPEVRRRRVAVLSFFLSLSLLLSPCT
jgi:hypothetical protein